MRLRESLRATIVALTCLGMVVPASAASPTMVTAEGIPVRQQVEDVVLQSGGELRGAIVDVNGKPVVGSSVAIGQSGKLVAELASDSEGRFVAKNLTAGTYQVATYAGVQNYRVWNTGAGPAQAKQGIVHVMSKDVARGNCNNGCNNDCNNECNGNCKSGGGSNPLVAALSSPKVLALAIITGVALFTLFDDDDAS